MMRRDNILQVKFWNNFHAYDTMVIGKTRKRAIDKLREIENLIESTDEKILVRSFDGIKTNKRAIRAIGFSNQRGYRYAEVYVDKNISKEDVDYCIAPCLCHAVQMDGDARKKLKDRIHYF